MFLALFMILILVREFLSLYALFRDFHPWAGFLLLIALAATAVYFIFIPLFQILTMPRQLSPVKRREAVEALARRRMQRMRRNPVLIDSGFDFQAVSDNEAGYRLALRHLEPIGRKIRKKYVTQVFYSTAIAQNGFLDALLILSAGVRLVKELFIVYHGRVGNRDLWAIARKVYFSMIVGGSEGIEHITEELFSKLTAGGIKSIPFASRVLGSLADGFVNAALLNRVAIITESYCTRLYLASEKDLYPSYKAVVSSTMMITSDLAERLIREVKSVVKEHRGDMLLMTVNPVGCLLGAAMTRMAEGSRRISPHQAELLRESAGIVRNPPGYVFRKVLELFRKEKASDFLNPIL